MPLILVRVPTFRRPELLKRALKCLQLQEFEDWICEVRDDCPEASARTVVEEVGDKRIHYIHNSVQKFSSKNLDDCFLKSNPHSADYFYMLEDDNQIFPKFLKTSCEIIEQNNVNICQINQRIEFRNEYYSYVTDWGIFDGVYDQGAYEPKQLRLAMFGSNGISNGAVFWSKRVKRELAFQRPIIPALDEYLRTILVDEPVYICRDRLAVWASDELRTSRNLGISRGRIRREVDLKSSLISLRRKVWRSTPDSLKEEFLAGGVLRIPMATRHEYLERSGLEIGNFPFTNSFKSVIIRAVGKRHESIDACFSE